MTKRLQEGQTITLQDARHECEHAVIVGPSRGWAELRCVHDRITLADGLIAAKPDGSWWWVRRLGAPEPGGEPT